MWEEDGNSIFRLVSTGTDGSLLKLRGSEGQRGALQFVDDSNVIDAEVSYFHSASPYIPSSMRFKVNDTTPMCVTSSQKVGIGTLDPDTPLEVRSDDDSNRAYLGGDDEAVYAENGSSTTGRLAMDSYDAQGTHISTGNYGRLGTPSHGVYGYAGSGSAYAGYFNGKVRVKGNLDIWNATQKILELGEGLDYAEGFDVSTDERRVGPGTVLVIDPENPGELAISTRAYDRKVAGIVAGAKGLGSGVRLGGGEFDQDVALAGRVYCNVVATDQPIEPGDLLTTSDLEGFAMKIGDYTRAQGAILGKAMEPLAKGERGQILVLVTLQ